MFRGNVSVSFRLTAQARAGETVPVVAAVAVGRTGVGAAWVGNAAALLHIHLPCLGKAQSAADPQTLEGKTQTFIRSRLVTDHRLISTLMETRNSFFYAPTMIQLRLVAVFKSASHLHAASETMLNSPVRRR